MILALCPALKAYRGYPFTEVKMKVFDFDNTLYHGESAVDLAIFMIKNNKKIILYLPKIFINLIKYKLIMTLLRR